MKGLRCITDNTPVNSAVLVSSDDIGIPGPVSFVPGNLSLNRGQHQYTKVVVDLNTGRNSRHLLDAQYVYESPLFLVQDTAVYVGDTLYIDTPGSRYHGTTVTVQDIVDGHTSLINLKELGPRLIGELSITKPIIKKKYWVNLYWQSTSSPGFKEVEGILWSSEEEANKRAAASRVACVEIEVEE